MRRMRPLVLINPGRQLSREMRMLPERKMMQKVKKNDERGGDLSHMLILPGVIYSDKTIL